MEGNGDVLLARLNREKFLFVCFLELFVWPVLTVWCRKVLSTESKGGTISWNTTRIAANCIAGGGLRSDPPVFLEF